MGSGRDKRKKKKVNNEKTSPKVIGTKPRKVDGELEDLEEIITKFNVEQKENEKIIEEVGQGPSRRTNASLTVNTLKAEELILFGGEFYNGQKTWKKISSNRCPAPRSGHQAVVNNSGLMFLFGGEFVAPNQTNFFHLKDFWFLDLKTMAWEKLELKGSRPTPRSGHRMVLWKHYLVLFGGFFDQVQDTKYLDDTWVFDTHEFKWTKIADTSDIKPSPRSGFQLLTNNNSVFLYGGYSQLRVKGKKTAGVVHNDCWVLKMNMDLSQISWSRAKKPSGNGPGSRSGCTMVTHKGKGLLFGGVSDIVEDEETLESIFHKDLYIFNFDSSKFFPAGKTGDDENVSPCARFSSMMAVSKNILYLFGGVQEDGDKEFTMCDLWCINADKLNQWTCLMKDETLVRDWIGEESDDESEDDEGIERVMDDGQEIAKVVTRGVKISRSAR